MDKISRRRDIWRKYKPGNVKLREKTERQQKIKELPKIARWIITNKNTAPSSTSQSEETPQKYLAVRKHEVVPPPGGSDELSPSEAFDVLLNDVKSAGRWQYAIFFITSFSGFFVGMQNMGSALISASPKFWCNLTELADAQSFPEIVQQEPDRLPTCSYYEAINGTTLFPLSNATGNLTAIECNSWHYNTSIYSLTTVSEWDLVCDDTWMNSASQSIYMAGVLAGGVVLSEMSDAYGRRTVTLYSTVFFIICSVASAFSINYSAFVGLRFFTAFFAFGIFIPTFVIFMEVVGSETRAWMGVLYQGLFGVGVCALSGIGYLIRDWRYLQVAISVPSVVLLLYFKFLPESPRWLLSHGKDKEAVAILARIAKVNGGQLPDEKDMNTLISTIVGRQSKKYNVFQMIFRFFKNQAKLVRTPVIRRRSLIMFFSWFVVSMVYYGLAFSANNINTSVYLLVFLSGISEVVSLLISAWTIGRFGRKIILSSSFVIAGICCLLILAVPKELVWVNVTFTSLGKFFTSVAFAVCYIFSAELVPTEMRNVSVGTCSMYARFGSMIAPFIVDLLGAIHYVIPSTVFGILSVLAGGFALLLPETGNQKLPETIEEIESQSR